MKKMLKKTFIIGIITVILSAFVTMLTPKSTYAADGFSGRGTQGQPPCEYILGMVSWDCNVNIKDEDSLKSGIWIIASNIAVDITVIVVYLAVGYIVYGGYLYILSRGDPGKVATGKKALTQAFIGLAIVMLANVILNTIRIALGGASLAENCTVEGTCVSNVDQMVIGAINWVISIVGVVSAIFVVYGGISYMTSAGDPGKLKKAKDTILYACIGLIIVALAWIISGFVSGLIRDANNSNTASLINESIIAKEIS